MTQKPLSPAQISLPSFRHMYPTFHQILNLDIHTCLKISKTQSGMDHLFLLPTKSKQNKLDFRAAFVQAPLSRETLPSSRVLLPLPCSAHIQNIHEHRHCTSKMFYRSLTSSLHDQVLFVMRQGGHLSLNAGVFKFVDEYFAFEKK